MKQSQVRIKRAALSEALMSIQPAIALGWLATTPTDRPFMRINPVTILVAYMAWVSKNSCPSAISRITSLIS